MNRQKTSMAFLVYTVVGMTAFFVLGNPRGIDDNYVATIIPAQVMAADRLFAKRRRSLHAEKK